MSQCSAGKETEADESEKVLRNEQARALWFDVFCAFHMFACEAFIRNLGRPTTTEPKWRHIHWEYMKDNEVLPHSCFGSACRC